MKQKEMAVYLKTVTIAITILFFAFTVWFLPTVIREQITKTAGKAAYQSACLFIWITAIPCFMSLWKFWNICTKIGKNQSFIRENAKELKHISHYIWSDSVLYVILLFAGCIMKWYRYSIGLLFGIVVILFICLFIVIAAAALSHLVYNASKLQEDSDLTI